MARYLVYEKGTDEYWSVDAEWASTTTDGIQFYQTSEEGEALEVAFFPMRNILGYQREDTMFRKESKI